MDPGMSKRVTRDEELFARLGSGQPIPADLDDETRQIAAQLQKLRSDLEVYQVSVIRNGVQVAVGYLLVYSGFLAERGEG